MEINELTGLIVDTSIKIHSAIGAGCFERVYEEILYYELHKRNINVARQVLMPLRYKDLCIKNAYKIDILVEKILIIEIKCVDYVLPVHFKQLMTYLNLMNIKNGMLLNFKSNLMKDGIHRVFNNFGL